MFKMKFLKYYKMHIDSNKTFRQKYQKKKKENVVKAPSPNYWNDFVYMEQTNYFC